MAVVPIHTFSNSYITVPPPSASTDKLHQFVKKNKKNTGDMWHVIHDMW